MFDVVVLVPLEFSCTIIMIRSAVSVFIRSTLREKVIATSLCETRTSLVRFSLLTYKLLNTNQPAYLHYLISLQTPRLVFFLF